jgi:probable phosphoglycerate mutase
MRVYVVRHGETEENARGVIQGHLQGTLSAAGRRQAELVGRRFAGEVIDHLYCSDLRRARDTVAEIARHHPEVPTTYTSDLRERFLGPYQGRRISDLAPGELGHSREVESSPAVVERAARVIAGLHHDHQGHTVVIVSHGGLIVAIRAALTGEDRDTLLDLEPMANAAVSVFEGDNNLVPVAWNLVDHLELP